MLSAVIGDATNIFDSDLGDHGGPYTGSRLVVDKLFLIPKEIPGNCVARFSFNTARPGVVIFNRDSKYTTFNCLRIESECVSPARERFCYRRNRILDHDDRVVVALNLLTPCGCYQDRGESYVNLHTSARSYATSPKRANARINAFVHLANDPKPSRTSPEAPHSGMNSCREG